MDSRSINELTFGGPTFTFGGPKKYAISKKLSVTVVSKSGFHQVMLHEMQQKTQFLIYATHGNNKDPNY